MFCVDLIVGNYYGSGVENTLLTTFDIKDLDNSNSFAI